MARRSDPTRPRRNPNRRPGALYSSRAVRGVSDHRSTPRPRPVRRRGRSRRDPRRPAVLADRDPVRRRRARRDASSRRLASNRRLVNRSSSSCRSSARSPEVPVDAARRPDVRPVSDDSSRARRRPGTGRDRTRAGGEKTARLGPIHPRASRARRPGAWPGREVRRPMIEHAVVLVLAGLVVVLALYPPACE